MVARAHYGTLVRRHRLTLGTNIPFGITDWLYGSEFWLTAQDIKLDATLTSHQVRKDGANGTTAPIMKL